MKTYPGIDPDLHAALKKVPTFTVGRVSLWLLRAAMSVMPRRGSIPRGVSVRDEVIRVGERRDEVRVRVYRPSASAEARPGLLWIHGGGYVMGRLEMDDATCAAYASEVGVVVVSVNYRLAPQHPFPAALHDCHAAFKWLHANARSLGVDTTRIAIGGASAGGGLAAALAQRVTDLKQEPCALQLLVYPMLDDRTTLDSAANQGSYLLWNRGSNRFGWASYLGGAARKPPMYAVPARREQLEGLPPAWIGVGTADLFHDEDLAYAHRLKESGVDCELYVAPGAFHGFDAVAPDAPVTQRFRAAQVAALRAHLFGAHTGTSDGAVQPAP